MAPPGDLHGLQLDEACLRQLVAAGPLGSALWRKQDAIEKALCKAYDHQAAASAMRRVSKQLTVRCLRRIASELEAYAQGQTSRHELATSEVTCAAKDLDQVHVGVEPSVEETRTVLSALVIAALNVLKNSESIDEGCRDGVALIFTFVRPNENVETSKMRCVAVDKIKSLARKGVNDGRTAMVAQIAKEERQYPLNQVIRKLKSYEKTMSESLGPIWHVAETTPSNQEEVSEIVDNIAARLRNRKRKKGADGSEGDEDAHESTEDIRLRRSDLGVENDEAVSARSNVPKKRGRFSREEDVRLIEGLNKFGWDNWEAISSTYFGGTPRRSLESLKRRASLLAKNKQIKIRPASKTMDEGEDEDEDNSAVDGQPTSITE